MAEKDDANILEQMRRAVEEKPLAEEPLSEETLRDLFQKYNTFLNSLNRQQRALLMNAQVSLKHAAESLDDVGPEELKAFLEKFTPPGGVLIRACGRHRRRGDIDE